VVAALAGLAGLTGWGRGWGRPGILAAMSDVIERTETLAVEAAYALGGLLDVPVPDLAGGAGLPLLWHWCYLLDRPAQADLGPDGHPVRGVLPAPPAPGLRRMWAGGRVRASGVLRCGEPATRLTRVLSMTGKVGRTGPMTFVVVGHQIVQRDQVVVDEEQDIVYRAPAAAAGSDGGAADGGAADGGAADGPASATDAAEAPVVPAGDGEREISVSPTLLFRFSALTYNAHRIHYDPDFARDVEGYPGLLTHGPLQALAMAEAARAAEGADLAASAAPGRERSFEYRLVSPLFDHQGMVVSAVPGGGATDTAVRDLYGRQTARGTLR
jgi:3-methylfumaryl-CoA hydratase